MPPHATRSIGTGECRHACGVLSNTLNSSFLWGDRNLVRSFFRLGHSAGFSELEFIYQIPSFAPRVRGEAPTSLTVPYPFFTSTWTRIHAKRDKREVRSFWILGVVRPRYYWIFAYVELDRKNQGTTFPNGYLNFFPTASFLLPPRSDCPVVATTAVYRCLSAQWV